jgi:hypothetical protein
MPSKNLFEIKQTKKRTKSDSDLLQGTRALAKIESLAQQALLYMQSYLMTHSKHPTGRLMSNLDIKIIKTDKGFTFGIGNIKKLNKESPYWYVLNYGKTITGKKFIPPAFVGSFEGDRPVAGKQGQQYVDEGNYYIQPKTFTPVNYIEATIAYIKNKLPKTSSVSRSFTRNTLPQV